MVTKSEKQVVEQFRRKGYFNTHSGAPDFIFYKLKKGIKNQTIEDIDISSVEFVEVKYNGDVLSHEQQIWKHILKKLGLKYSLIHVSPKKDFGVN